ncbi:MAG: AtpZ/AtpI family protein [bacterium]|nr:AtpZ/AtpI family protein [bacterium]
MGSNQNDDQTWSALGLAFQLGYLIAIPIVLLAVGGRFLDHRFGTSPWLLLAGVLLSLVVSSVLVARKAKEVMDGTKQDGGNNRNPPSSV